MAESAQREMTLREWVERLPASHLARREYDALTAEAVRMNQAAGGEAVAWEVRVMYGPHGPDAGKWSKWQGCDKATHDAVQRGEGFCEYETAEARALVVIGTTPPAAQVQQEADEAWADFVSMWLGDDEGEASLQVRSLCRAAFEAGHLATHPAADALWAVRDELDRFESRLTWESSQGSEDGAHKVACEALMRLRQALAQAPAVQVTDEMVEQAVIAYWHDCASPTQYEDSHSADRGHMRAALEAALAQPQEAAHPSACELGAVEQVASHIGAAVRFIEANYPDAAMLDRGPILRNMRRWASKLEAALQHRGDSRGGEAKP